MIDAHHPALQRIARALLEQDVVTAEDIPKLVEQPRDQDEAPEASAPRQVR